MEGRDKPGHDGARTQRGHGSSPHPEDPAQLRLEERALGLDPNDEECGSSLPPGDALSFATGFAFAMPRSVIHPLLDGLHVTVRSTGEQYWHIHLIERQGEYCLLLPKRTSELVLTPYAVKL